MLYDERLTRHDNVMAAARLMMTAARTAPKAKGVDLIEVMVADGEHLNQLAGWMRRYAADNGRQSFTRDAANVEQSECVVLIATRQSPMGLDCGYCGQPACAQKDGCSPCAFNAIDVGIAVGSACATAADCRVDSRVMYSAGLAAQQLNWLPGCGLTIAILVSASSKSPYFDRKAL